MSATALSDKHGKNLSEMGERVAELQMIIIEHKDLLCKFNKDLSCLILSGRIS